MFVRHQCLHEDNHMQVNTYVKVYTIGSRNPQNRRYPGIHGVPPENTMFQDLGIFKPKSAA